MRLQRGVCYPVLVNSVLNAKIRLQQSFLQTQKTGTRECAFVEIGNYERWAIALSVKKIVLWYGSIVDGVRQIVNRENRPVIRAGCYQLLSAVFSVV